MKCSWHRRLQAENLGWKNTKFGCACLKASVIHAEWFQHWKLWADNTQKESTKVKCLWLLFMQNMVGIEVAQSPALLMQNTVSIEGCMKPMLLSTVNLGSYYDWGHCSQTPGYFGVLWTIMLTRVPLLMSWAPPPCSGKRDSKDGCMKLTRKVISWRAEILNVILRTT